MIRLSMYYKDCKFTQFINSNRQIKAANYMYKLFTNTIIILITSFSFTQNFWMGTSVAIPDNLDAISINPAGLGIDRGKQNGIYIPFDSVFTTYFSNRFNGFGYDLKYEFIDKSFPNLFNPSDGNIGFGTILFKNA